ncbi:MAG TPA: CAP domain-containing protein, partial [Bacillota bacterium]|nr:CAP domain-containing protein [Bacillota bacterium]
MINFRTRLNSRAVFKNQERTLFGLVNKERKSAGLRPLRLNAKLTFIARLKCQDMINHHYFSHQSPVYGRLGNLLRAAGIRFTLAAENISKGGNARSAFSAFMQSSGHRNKILDPR